jgi:enoyl-CoA hydratase
VTAILADDGGPRLRGDDLGSPYLRFERHGALARCVVDRPDSRNALTSAMYFGLRRAVDPVNRAPELAALVITGTGDVFIPGGELRGREPDKWLYRPRPGPLRRRRWPSACPRSRGRDLG